MFVSSNDLRPSRTPKRVLAYCHDSVGIGHLRRTLAICERVGRVFPECSFLIATGTPYVPMFNLKAKIDTLKLPALSKEGDGYCSKFLGMSLQRMIQFRQSLLLQATKDLAPDVLLVDKAPLGVCRELLPTLNWLHENRPDVPIVFGMRDVEDDPESTIAQWTHDGVQSALDACFHEIWVYGMQGVFDVVREYRLPGGIAEKTHYAGYVRRDPCDHAPRPRIAGKQVLVTVGGGTDGERLLSTYLEQTAAAVARLGATSTVVGGPDLPPPVAAKLREKAAHIPATHWLDFEPCMGCRIKQSDLIVSMGGYNTMCEVASVRKPMLVIPRVKPRLEQLMRARLWERLGAARCLPPDELTPQVLTQRVMQMLAAEDGPMRHELDMAALEFVEQRFSQFFAEEPSRATAVRV
ncbi:MurG-like transferase [Phycisphaerae bacterium RAS1]|nr:MurG-like transferase [Phycisphaerae bacterium RAS1]